jgi:hypothetical protein
VSSLSVFSTQGHSPVWAIFTNGLVVACKRGEALINIGSAAQIGTDELERGSESDHLVLRLVNEAAIDGESDG